MSLIVQVNGNGGGPGPAPPQPPGPPQQQTSHHMTQSLVTQIPSPTPTLQASQPPLSVLSRVANQQLTNLARLGSQHHVVQHHPQPLRMVHLPNGNPAFATNSVVTSVALPSSPTPVAIRQILPQTPVGVGRPPQLPRSPLRQHQLPQAPILRHQMAPASPSGVHHHHHHHQHQQQRLVAAAGQGQMRTYHPMKVGGPPAPAGTIMVTQRQQLQPPTLAMLPQAPSPGHLPSVPSPGLMPVQATNLMTFPLKIQSAPLPMPSAAASPHSLPQPHLSAPTPILSSSGCAILPPNTLHHQLFPASNNDSDE